jgi:DNA polymerase III epsilon subunit-like protein
MADELEPNTAETPAEQITEHEEPKVENTLEIEEANIEEVTSDGGLKIGEAIDIEGSTDVLNVEDNISPKIRESEHVSSRGTEAVIDLENPQIEKNVEIALVKNDTQEVESNHHEIVDEEQDYREESESVPLKGGSDDRLRLQEPVERVDAVEIQKFIDNAEDSDSSSEMSSRIGII